MTLTRTMRRPAQLSALIHLTILLLILLRLPSFMKPEPVEIAEEAIVVDVVTVADTTNVPKPAPQTAPNARVVRADPAPEPPVEQAQPEPPKPEPPKPEPPKPPEPTELADLKPLPQPVAPPPPLDALPPPEPKPEPVNLAALDKLAQPSLKPPEELKPLPKPETKPKDDFFDQIDKAIKTADKPEQKPKPPPRQASASAPSDPTRPLTASQRALVERTIAPCWNIDLGGLGASDLAVEVRLTIDPDGTMRDPQIVDAVRYGSDRYFRAAADATRRAILNPQCNKLPFQWTAEPTGVFVFHPKDVIG